MKLPVSERIFLKLIKNPAVRLHAGLNQATFKPEDALMLTGDPRSGTTWLGEVISAERGVTTILEPLGLNRKHMAALDFTWRMFIPPEGNRPDVKAYFDQLLSGQVINPLDRHQAPLADIWQTQRWFVKFTRANRLLPWLTTQYQFTYRPIHIIRHPCGVVYSQLKHRHFGKLSGVGPHDRAWIAEHRPTLLPLVDSIKTEIQTRALTWALDNYIPLTYWSADKWMVYSYEELVLNSDAKLTEIYQAWGKDVPDSVLAQVTQKSRAAHQWAQFDESGRKRLGSWKEHLTGEQIAEILEIVHAVGLPEFTEEIEPNYRLLYRRHE